MWFAIIYVLHLLFLQWAARLCSAAAAAAAETPQSCRATGQTGSTSALAQIENLLETCRHVYIFWFVFLFFFSFPKCRDSASVQQSISPPGFFLLLCGWPTRGHMADGLCCFASSLFPPSFIFGSPQFNSRPSNAAATAITPESRRSKIILDSFSLLTFCDEHFLPLVLFAYSNLPTLVSFLFQESAAAPQLTADETGGGFALHFFT